MKGLLALGALPLLALSSPVFNTETIHKDAAPVLSSTQAKEIPDSYIIVFKKHVSHEAAAVHHTWVQDQHAELETTRRQLSKRSQMPLMTYGGLRHTYNLAGGFLGYSGHFDEDVIEKVRRHPDVSAQHWSTLQFSTLVWSLYAVNSILITSMLPGRLYRTRLRSTHHG